jgi:hypothetical protein
MDQVSRDTLSEIISIRESDPAWRLRPNSVFRHQCGECGTWNSVQTIKETKIHKRNLVLDRIELVTLHAGELVCRYCHARQ